MLRPDNWVVNLRNAFDLREGWESIKGPLEIATVFSDPLPYRPALSLWKTTAAY